MKKGIMYKRNCPRCGKQLRTKNKFWNKKAIREKRLCCVCSGKFRIITEEWKENMRKNHANVSGKNNPFYGKTHTDKTLKILSLPKTEEHKRKLAISLKGNPSPLKGKHHTDEAKRKMRISAIKRITKYKFDGLSMCPNVNKKETDYFVKLENEKGWNGIFFGKDNKNQQYLIENLGYFVDYYEPEKNIIVEYDETLHYNKDWTLKEKDIKRQEEIIKTLHCKFYRYNEVLDKLYEVKLL